MDGLWANDVKAPAKLTAVRPAAASNTSERPSRARLIRRHLDFAGNRYRHVVDLCAACAGVNILWPHPRLQTCEPVRVRSVAPRVVTAEGGQPLTRVFFKTWFSGFWTVPCYSVKHIELSFGGHRFAIHPNDFYLGRVSARSTDCVAGVLSIGNRLPANLAIIGDEFLKSCECLSSVTNLRSIISNLAQPKIQGTPHMTMGMAYASASGQM